MKVYQFKSVLLAIGILTSCSLSTENKSEIINHHHYNIWLSDLNRQDLIVSTVVHQSSITKDGLTIFQLKTPSAPNSVYSYHYAMKGSSFYYFNDYCKLIDTIYFDTNNKTIPLFVSDYNLKESVDEESYIFWNHNHGLVAVYNYTAGPLLIFVNPIKSEFTQEEFYNFFIERLKRSNQY